MVMIMMMVVMIMIMILLYFLALDSHHNDIYLCTKGVLVLGPPCKDLSTSNWITFWLLWALKNPLDCRSQEKIRSHVGKQKVAN